MQDPDLLYGGAMTMADEARARLQRELFDEFAALDPFEQERQRKSYNEAMFPLFEGLIHWVLRGWNIDPPVTWREGGKLVSRDVTRRDARIGDYEEFLQKLREAFLLTIQPWSPTNKFGYKPECGRSLSGWVGFKLDRHVASIFQEKERSRDAIHWASDEVPEVPAADHGFQTSWKRPEDGPGYSARIPLLNQTPAPFRELLIQLGIDNTPVLSEATRITERYWGILGDTLYSLPIASQWLHDRVTRYGWTFDACGREMNPSVTGSTAGRRFMKIVNRLRDAILEAAVKEGDLTEAGAQAVIDRWPTKPSHFKGES